jgi:hypothetical protein
MILIKQHNSHTVAHLYEHLFGMAIDDFFYDNKLFPYLDYDVIARTIHGIIYIDITLNTDEAKELIDRLPDLKISLGEPSFDVAIGQISSELRYVLGIVGGSEPNWGAVRDELREIEAKQWQNIDDVDILDPRKSELIQGALYEPKHKKKIKTRKIEVSYELDEKFANEHKEMRPLFTQISSVMSENVRADLYSEFGFYAYELKFEPEFHARRLVRSFRFPYAAHLDIKEVYEVIHNSLVDLSDAGAYNRFIGQLKQVKSTDLGILFPNPYNNYKHTDVVIGAKGWNRIATDANCNMLLSQMVVHLRIDEKIISIKLNDLFKISGEKK